jgi:hypothetical protein
MARLLTIGLQVLCCTEYIARENLQKREESTIAGLYKGNPTRRTPRPTAEALLKAFEGIDCSTISPNGVVHRYITPLSALQTDIIRLLELPSTLYDAPTSACDSPPVKRARRKGRDSAPG